jgi:hypothetical protein
VPEAGTPAGNGLEAGKKAKREKPNQVFITLKPCLDMPVRMKSLGEDKTDFKGFNPFPLFAPRFFKKELLNLNQVTLP